MIKIKKPKKAKGKKEPHYVIKYQYMIGDANGYTTEKVKVSADNPFVERYCKLLNSLKATKGHWGVMLEEDRLDDFLKEKQITKDDYKFLSETMFDNFDFCDDEDIEIEEDRFKHCYFKTKEEQKFASEFYEGVRSDTEYSFLVFEYVELFYVDEDGIKHETEFK